jgi:UDP-N-acetylmuramate dehydrogenase
VYPLGEGSNILAGDGEIRRAILSLDTHAVAYEENDTGVLAIADAGVSWNAFVEETAERELWGLENLAGIPGTVGAAPVQNIGAYGREAADVLAWVEAYDPVQDAFVQISKDDCAFAYRDSRFKRSPGLLITRVAFSLSKEPQPLLSYPDLRARLEAGADLASPRAIAQEVRAIRAQKFPDLSLYGTAGSFFKNPTISPEAYARLSAQHDGLPGYANATGVKIPLAWILDHVLGMRGFAHGPVSLFEKQPLVLVAQKGATAHDVDALAAIVTERAHDATNIFIEREVQSLA